MERLDIAVFVDAHGEFEIRDVELLRAIGGARVEDLAAQALDHADENGMCPNGICGSDQVCGNTSCWGLNGYCNKNYVCVDIACIL